MAKLLNEGFVEELKKVLEYVRSSEYSNFMECDDGALNDHVYKSVLILDSYLGDEVINHDVAIRLLETDVRDCVMIGTEQEGYIHLEEDKEINQFEETKLWI